jgi:hypothetical protein
MAGAITTCAHTSSAPAGIDIDQVDTLRSTDGDFIVNAKHQVKSGCAAFV